MGNGQHPTRRTIHMDLKKFSSLDWIKKDLMVMKHINFTDNSSDVLAKQAGKQLFYRHFDYIIGQIKPHYVKVDKSQSQKHQISTDTMDNDNLINLNCNSPMSLNSGVLLNKEGISPIGE